MERKTQKAKRKTVNWNGKSYLALTEKSIGLGKKKDV